MFTPYAAAKAANERLESEGLAKRVRPQMMYNYTVSKVNAGEKPLIAYSVENGVDTQDFARWLDAYVAKQHKAAGTHVELDEQAKFDAAEAH